MKFKKKGVQICSETKLIIANKLQINNMGKLTENLNCTYCSTKIRILIFQYKIY